MIIQRHAIPIVWQFWSILRFGFVKGDQDLPPPLPSPLWIHHWFIQSYHIDIYMVIQQIRADIIKKQFMWIIFITGLLVPPGELLHDNSWWIVWGYWYIAQQKTYPQVHSPHIDVAEVNPRYLSVRSECHRSSQSRPKSSQSNIPKYKRYFFLFDLTSVTHLGLPLNSNGRNMWNNHTDK